MTAAAGFPPPVPPVARRSAFSAAAASGRGLRGGLDAGRSENWRKTAAAGPIPAHLASSPLCPMRGRGFMQGLEFHSLEAQVAMLAVASLNGRGLPGR
jgi:hypothetical protein